MSFLINQYNFSADPSPIPTSNLILYLNPNQGVSQIASAVANWFDKLSNPQRVASMNIDITRRPTVVNGLIRFDGNNDSMIVSSPNLIAARLHIFVAVRTLVTNKAHVFLRKSTNVASPTAAQFEWGFGPRSASGSGQTDRKMEFRVTDGAGNANTFISSDATPHDTLFLAEATLGVSGAFEYRENGLIKGSATLIEVPQKDAQNAIILGGIGSQTDPLNRWLNGSLGLIAVYSEVQSNINVNAIYQHFRDVHGLTITDRV